MGRAESDERDGEALLVSLPSVLFARIVGGFRMRRFSALLVPCFALLLLVPAVSAQDATPMAMGTPAASLLAGLGYPDLVVTSDGKTNDLPASLAAGRYHLVLHNTNPTNAISIDFYMTPADVSEADALAFYAEAAASQDKLPDLFYKVTIPGGVNVAPNSTGEVIIDLKPGDGKWYAGFQIQSDNDSGTGQAQPLEITGTMPTLTDPTAAVTATLADLTIDIPDSVGTGPQIWKVTNTGSMPHFLALSMSDGSLTPENVEATFGTFIGTPAPAGATPVPFGSLQQVLDSDVLSSGQSMWIEVDLQPGQYLAACYLSGPGDLQMHAAMGMFKIFEAA
jgi:hypothetical protein